MNIQDKLQRAQKAIDSIATHDDKAVEEVEQALDDIADYAGAAADEMKVRRLGSGMVRFLNYWKQLGKALIGRA